MPPVSRWSGNPRGAPGANAADHGLTSPRRGTVERARGAGPGGWRRPRPGVDLPRRSAWAAVLRLARVRRPAPARLLRGRRPGRVRRAHSAARGLGRPGAPDEAGQLLASVDAELLVDVTEVELHRLRCDEQSLGDLTRGQPLGG